MIKSSSISIALRERGERLTPDEANELAIPRIQKIDFKGQPLLVEHKETKTGMIVVRRGDVLISGINAEKGAVCIFNEADKATATIHYSAYTIDRDKASPEFLEWFLKSKFFQRALIEQVGGGIKTEIKAKKFLSLQVPLPAVARQKEIVKQLNSLASKTSKIEELEKENKKLVGILQKQILMSVIGSGSGSDWQPNIEYLIPDDWEWKELGDLLLEKPRNGYSPSAVNYETNVKTLKLGATTTGKFKANEFKYIPEDIASDSYLWLQPGDILVQRSNSIDYVGVSAIYDDGPSEFIYPDLMMKLRVDDEITPEYLHLVLSSPFIRTYFKNSASGTSGNMPKINQKIVMKAMIPVPPLDVQYEAVEKAKDMMAKIEKLSSLLADQKVLLPELINATLSKALTISNDAVPVKAAKPNISFSIQQAMAALLSKGFKKGEMAIAKVLYLVQEVYETPIGIQFTAQSFGPYDASVRKALTSGLSTKNKFFIKSGPADRAYFELSDAGSKVLKYDTAQATLKALDDLLPKLGSAGSKDIERLASVCKIMQDLDTTDADAIKKRMLTWKAGRFSDAEIDKSITFIKNQGWDKKLLTTD